MHPFALPRGPSKGTLPGRIAAAPLQQDQPDRAGCLGDEHHPGAGCVAVNPVGLQNPV
jgi:hypothetical protein